MTVAITGRSREEIAAETSRLGLTLSPEEWRRLAGRLGRDPTLPEAFLLDVSWSEHCSYKSSKALLRRYLPASASHVVLGPGEDAGIVSLGRWNGEEWVLVAAHESHNHPSQVLPVEGAATGIGGIVRDVYCMGCDVAGVLDPLRFGDPDGENAARTRAIVRGVVEGIAVYGNALGVPNLGGDVVFHEGFDDNCLVNVVALGVMRRSRILRSRVPEDARRRPYAVILVGKPTDATGLGGASFASQILDERDAAENRGAVQVHDPFLKRVLVEATKEIWTLLEGESIPAGCKDLGAGGLGGASSELALAGGFGLEVDLSLVPRSARDAEPHQILCGETQERFVWAVPAERAGAICAVFNERYELGRVYPEARAQIIGRVVDEAVFRCFWQGEVVVDLPAPMLAESPIEDRPRRPRPEPAPVADPAAPRSWKIWAREQLSSWNAASRAPVFRGYDQEVRGEAFLRPGEADAGICRPIPGASLGLAVSADGNPNYGALDPYWAGALAVLESARNVVATGAAPLAATDCLNFGSPEDPVCLGDFEETLRGMADACRAIGSPAHPEEPLPLISGNVSFYNQSSRGRAIPPSPVVACFGVLDDYGSAATPSLKRPGDAVLLTGRRARAWGRPGTGIGGRVPRRPLEEQAAELRAVLELAREGLLAAAHDVSDGGMLRALVEMGLGEDAPGRPGVAVDLSLCGAEMPAHEILLSETPGFLLEIAERDAPAAQDRLRRAGVACFAIGRVTADPVLRIRQGDTDLLEIGWSELHEAWRSKLEPLFDPSSDVLGSAPVIPPGSPRPGPSGPPAEPRTGPPPGAAPGSTSPVARGKDGAG